MYSTNISQKVGKNLQMILLRRGITKYGQNVLKEENHQQASQYSGLIFFRKEINCTIS